MDFFEFARIENPVCNVRTITNDFLHIYAYWNIADSTYHIRSGVTDVKVSVGIVG